MSGSPRIGVGEWRSVVSEDDDTLPDGLLSNTDPEHWDRFLRAIAEAGWETSVPADVQFLVLSVFPGQGVRINVWRWEPDSISFDFDLRHLLTQEALDSFSEFVRTVGLAVDRDVRLVAEGSRRLYATYRADRDTFELAR